MAKRFKGFIIPILAFTLLSFSAGLAYSEEIDRIDLLLIIEELSFQPLLQAQVLASVVKESGLFNLDGRIVDVESGFDLPLIQDLDGKSYDLIVIIPKGGLETFFQIWAITDYPITPPLQGAIQFLSAVVGEVFSPKVEVTDVAEDLIPGYFAAVFLRDGLLEENKNIGVYH